LPAPQLARQGLRIDKADMAAPLAGDLEHHPRSSSGAEQTSAITKVVI
jgi:hypothetical protein